MQASSFGKVFSLQYKLVLVFYFLCNAKMTERDHDTSVADKHKVLTMYAFLHHEQSRSTFRNVFTCEESSHEIPKLL